MFSLNVRLPNTMKHCFFISTPHRIIDINDIHFNENDLTYLLHSKGQRARYLLQPTSTHSTRSVSSQHPHPTSFSTSTPTRFSAGHSIYPQYTFIYFMESPHLPKYTVFCRSAPSPFPNSTSTPHLPQDNHLLDISQPTFPYWLFISSHTNIIIWFSLHNIKGDSSY